MAGFRSPLFVLGLSAAAVVQQAGFTGPIPVLPLGATTAPLQAGFIGPIPILNLGAGEPITPTPDIALTGGGGSRYDYEEEEIIAVISAYMYRTGRAPG